MTCTEHKVIEDMVTTFQSLSQPADAHPDLASPDNPLSLHDRYLISLANAGQTAVPYKRQE